MAEATLLSSTPAALEASLAALWRSVVWMLSED